MNGILVADKPQGFTSFDVVAKLRGICGTKKIGHGGTLDPMATGVLPVFVGGATKAADMAPDTGKEYLATVLLGTSTSTGDITGEVLRTAPAKVRETEIISVLPQFLGCRLQTPPMVSAVKVNGKPLYKYAREGKAVERKPRAVTVYAMDWIGAQDETQFSISVRCSKGTYIRTLAEELGAALGLPATLSALRRTRSGRFTLAQAHTLEEIQAARAAGKLESLLLETQVLFEDMPPLKVDAQAAARLLNGAPVYRVCAAVCTEGGAHPSYKVRLFGPDGFMGIGVLCQDGRLCAEKLFITRQST